MNKKEIYINIVRFIALVLFQVYIINNIELSAYINPYIYVMFILLLPLESPKWLLLVLAFLIGFTMDIFMKTLGMNTAATVFMAWARPGLISLLSRGKDVNPGMKPGIKDFGFRWFFTYTLILVFLHHLMLFYIEVFKFTNFFDTLSRVLLSTVFSVFLIILIHYMFYKKK